MYTNKGTEDVQTEECCYLVVWAGSRQTICLGTITEREREREDAAVFSTMDNVKLLLSHSLINV